VLSSGKEKAAAIDFLNEVWAKDVDFYQAILADPAVRSARCWPRAAARPIPHLTPSSVAPPSGRQFSEYLGKVPSVNYGMYTYEG
jgi:lactose/L-arabinose transport system substrate-binding protein